MSVDVSELSAHLPAPQRQAVRADFKRSAKSATTAFVLCFFLGIIGAHCFYLGKTRQGLLRLVLSPLVVPGLIWEIIDLFHIDREVEHDNLVLAEQLIARAALSVPLSAGAIAAAPHVVVPIATSEVRVAPSAFTAPPPVIPEELPVTRVSDPPPQRSAPAIAEEPPPIWPFEPEPVPEIPAWAKTGGSPEPEAEAAAASGVPTESQAIPDMPPEPATASTPASSLADTASTDDLAHGEQAGDAPWIAAVAPAVIAPIAYGALTAHAATPNADPHAVELADEPTVPELPADSTPIPANGSRTPDFTDHAAYGEPAPVLADVGEDTGTRLRVVLPEYNLARSPAPAEPVAEPTVEEPAGPPAAPADEETPSSVVFVADPSYGAQAPDEAASEPETRPAAHLGDVAALAAGGALAGAAASFAEAEPRPATSVGFDLESPTGPMPAISPTDEGEPRTRVVKRVRVVRRLVVDGKVVHEAVAEQVVDPDVDTTATATSLQEALRSGDGPRIARLTKPLPTADHERPTTEPGEGTDPPPDVAVR